ncbi:hypothetical protein HMPREF9412_5526 [Paenibacillus sp. HGF5]|nr:hypothetical protein HMPREF9412_5526 [Paenibacillus sp. HGF5]
MIFLLSNNFYIAFTNKNTFHLMLIWIAVLRSIRSITSVGAFF